MLAERQSSKLKEALTRNKGNEGIKREIGNPYTPPPTPCNLNKGNKGVKNDICDPPNLRPATYTLIDPRHGQ